MGSVCCADEPNKEALAEAKSQATRKGPSNNDMDDEKKEEKIDPTDFVNQFDLYIIQARNLPKYDIGINAKSDPYVKVKIGDKHFRTRTVRRELSPVWNDHIAVSGKALFSQIKQIEFEVYDHDKISKDDLMGICSIETDTAPNANYATAIQWIDLVDKNNKPVMGRNKKRAGIQIQIRYAINSEDLNIRYYTHVMELKVKKGKNIKSKELIGKSDPYVNANWGAQSYRTKYVSNTEKPEWNETAFLFVHEKFQDKFQLKLTVMDKDIGHDDLLGTGYVSAKRIFTKCKEGATDSVDVQLRMVPVSLDRGLIDFSKDEKFKPWGDLEIEVKLVPRNKVEQEFYLALAKTFDKNNDGVIDKEEAQTMFHELKIPRDVNEFFDKFDENNDSKIDEKEVVKMLSDSDFQGSELATQLMGIYLGGDLGDDFQKHLMTGFTHKPTSTSKVIHIKDRETGLIVQEFVPGYVWYSLKLLYDSKLNRALVQSKVSQKILYQMSKSKGKSMNQPKSAAEIPAFIKQHNLNSDMLWKKPNQFKTFNDFFARGIRADEYRPISHPEDETVILSPADCRLMCWDSILDSTKVWIKGKKFTLEHLVTRKSKIDISRYSGGSFVIARLAPQDYHRWHYPASGKVIKIEKIDGALYTVNPIAVNKAVDVYTANKRAVLEIDGGDKTGRYLMFVIAATMVGSYALHRTEAKDPITQNPVPLQLNDEVKRGDVAGEFRFGGSTILLLFEPNKIKFDEDIVRNVKAKFETLATVRSRIGRIQ